MTAHETKTFKSGNSEAVRLPRGMGFGIGTDLRIERDGNRVILSPLVDPTEEKRKWLEMLDALAALPKPSYVQEREPFEFPERPGL